MFKRLKNIEDNLVEVDDNDNKVGIFRIIKDIKDRGIKIGNDDEAVSDLINKMFNEKYEKNIYIESEIDIFLEKYGDKNIYISYDKNKFNTEEITKSLKKLRNKLINLSKFKEEYNKFVDNISKFEYYQSKKEPGSVSPNQKKMIRYARDLKDITDLYNLKSDSDTSKNGEGLKILNNKQMLNRLLTLLAQIEAGNNSIKLKMKRLLYSLYRSKVLTKTVYNNLIKSIRA